MPPAVFGIDFGTTNSLASIVVDGEARALLDERQLPHPSVLWYRGDGLVVGRRARDGLDFQDGAVAEGFVRSPKMDLRRDGPIHVDGREIDPVDAVAAVLRHLQADAHRHGSGASFDLRSAVMTIPVDFGGEERRRLRAAARRAGIGVVQFVHEPAAALYGHLRQRADFRRDVAELSGQFVLVFDWGGGTLDLTLCRISAGSVQQLASVGDNEVGGDRFDLALRNLARERHAGRHGLLGEQISALEYPGMGARLLADAERRKIELSETSEARFFIRRYLRLEGAASTLDIMLGIADVEETCSDLISRGLGAIDRLLGKAKLRYTDVSLCLATGGMVRMPAIKRGLVERFGGRLVVSPRGDRIISEGAAWIAHDGLRLSLAKPIEVKVADKRERAGAYIPLVQAGQPLPRENESLKASVKRFYCSDPRDGEAVFELAKPRRLGRVDSTDDRETLGVVAVPVDPTAEPFVERLLCEVEIDHDYVAQVSVTATGTSVRRTAEFHHLEFALELPPDAPHGEPDATEDPARSGRQPPFDGTPSLRPNIVAAGETPHENTRHIEHRWAIAGDAAQNWYPAAFSNFDADWTELQREERDFYVRCSVCKRSITRIRLDGPLPICSAACHT